MRKLLYFLLMVLWIQPVLAASSPARPVAAAQGSFFTVVEKSTPAFFSKKSKAKKPNLFQKAKLKILQACQAKGYLVEGEITEKQKRQAKWSLILGLGSIVLLMIPYVGFLAIPAAITGLVLGIKSVNGNTNTNGIIGIIASGLTLLLLLVAIAVLAAFFASWN